VIIHIHLFQYNYNREQRLDPALHRRTPTELELSSDLEAARPQTAGNAVTPATVLK
jgi:hypothetical protein